MNSSPYHRYLPGLALIMLLLVGSMLLFSACTRIPFMPHREIDSFQPAAGEEPLETMEVKGIVYVKVVTSGNDSPESSPSSGTWIPLDVFRRGNFQPYRSALLQPLETAPVEPAVGTDMTAVPPANQAIPDYPREMQQVGGALSEEPLVEKEERMPPVLRRRGIFFPSRAAILRPHIVSQLTLELERELPLNLLPADLIPPRPDSWQTNTVDDLVGQTKDWLQLADNLPLAQLIFLLTETAGSPYAHYLVTILDAQSASPIASFPFHDPADPRRPRTFVPRQPIPLIQLVMTSPWWCTINPGDDQGTILLAAGLKSGMVSGLPLVLRQAAAKVVDPVDGSLLGFALGPPVGEAVVTDFFGQDGAFAHLRDSITPMPAGCVAVPLAE
ncbi:MAG: hypothetical protein JXO49_05665 [Deltaproteobacteria bacterium]|nr:hypothetical protein [Candidatus Anaeroferrophillus wilburensis]MBN2888813.1 hypothetical protein [Deltaproteobacteria bacterium]